ncbi:ribosomal RNA-processing protein 7 homolog A [Bombyx mandarina]|uniref:Ribosomal RNA-processing protein 7 homolog A n=1 Tax=Bombyx mandarina TaxID=7092 RepID=A0A6J2KPG0_BOMMA|nr:ribosomal RNA-processing protein 7 homolog A [Bombyx mandarina]
MKATKRTHDFKALALKLNDDSSYPHYIYFKEHSVREHTKDKPAGRTIFIVNVPPYADEKGLTNAFSEAGPISSVKLCIKPNTMEDDIPKFISEKQKKSFQVAYLVFEKVSALDRALQLSELKPLNSESYRIKTGIQKWIEEFNKEILQPKTLKENIEAFMKKYDSETAKEKKKEKKLEQEDDEGWVTVTKGGKIQSFARTEKVENKILEKEEKNKKRKELKNFYTFQIRESKMKHIVMLRQKFEEDKKKIAQIKQSRRFKPF